MNSYVAGNFVRVKVAFTDVNGNAIDPATVVLKFNTVNAAAPSVTTTWTYGVTGSIVKDSAGNYHADLDSTGKPGTWTYEWECPSGTGQTVAYAQYLVTSPPL